MLNQSGIYLIVCRPTGEQYVGGTKVSFGTRFTAHRTQLRRGVCSVPKLQEAHDKYGMEALAFIPLKAFPPEEIAAREREAIEFLKPALNTCGVGGRASYARWEPIVVGGQQMTVTEAARRYGLEPNTIRLRIKRGLSGDDLIAPPHKAPREPNRGWYSRQK